MPGTGALEVLFCTWAPPSSPLSGVISDCQSSNIEAMPSSTSSLQTRFQRESLPELKSIVSAVEAIFSSH